ncbi:MAG TPA: hypothetical protein VHP37_05535 [Burkholderiales bacterium]|nr:hypothetical protein [Burkholderiales bacterium]
MSGFDAAWLTLREPFDAQARDASLAERFTTTLSNTKRRIVDLAAGTGAAFRALAPLLRGDQDWLLVDHDPELVAAQQDAIRHWAARNGWACEALGDGVCIRAANATWIVRACALDLAHDLEALDLEACDGVTASALLDLVSAGWIDRLCAVLAANRLPLLAMLSVDGRRVWNPSAPADADIDRAFVRHQSRDKGFGPALGARAAAVLSERLEQRGYEVTTARSDWRIGADHPAMLLRMADEAAAVTAETEPGMGARFAEWQTARRRQIDARALALEVGHLDVVGVPRSR